MKAFRANYADINPLAKLCQRLHQTSSWKELEFNMTLVRKNLMEVVREPGMDVLAVKDDEGNYTGILLATVEQFFICKELYATDIHFMCEKGGIQLFAEFRRWAKEHNAKKIVMGIANDDPEGKVHAFYKMVGMRQVGDAWVYDLQDETKEQAA